MLCIIRAFDTLAKVLHPGDGSAGESLEATMQLISGDQSGPVVELEGPLLSDSHIPFKVKGQPLIVTLPFDLKTPDCVKQSCIVSIFLFSFPIPAAYDAFACARVPQCQLHL